MARFDLRKWAETAKGRGNWLSLLLSLFLAFFIWTVHNLSLPYSVFLQYSLKVKTNIEGRAPEALSKDKLILKVRATGYYILQQRLSRNGVVSVELDSKYLHKLSDDSDEFILYCSEIRNLIESQIDVEDKVVVEHFTTESVIFSFPAINSKKVPVVAREQIDYASQYMPVESIKVVPDSILIYGEERYLVNISSLITDIITSREAKSTVQGFTKVIVPRNISASADEVFYSQEVGRYIEQTLHIPLALVNVPYNKNIILMSSGVNVKFRAPFDYQKEIGENDFRYVIDYNDILSSIDSKVVPKMQKCPDILYSIEIDPPFVECLVIDKEE